MKTVEMKDTQMYSNMQTEAASIGWDLTLSECELVTKTMFNGITDYLNIAKNKSTPVAVMVQDVKGEKIAFGCVKYDKSEDNESSDGSWEYFWSFDPKDIPENATVYIIDQEPVQRVIAKRGHNMCQMVVGVLNYISVLCCVTFSIVHDTLDQQDVAEGDEYTIELPGFFEASVSVENGEKVFSITPKEEMKVLIKADEDKAE